MNRQPPKWPLAFLRWFCHPEWVEDIEGDLLERYRKRPSRWRYTLEVLKLFRPSLIRLSGRYNFRYSGLLRHYFLLTIRGFGKEKSYAITNLLGLTLSISISLVIWQHILNEQAVDSHHVNKDNKYCINYSYFEGDELVTKSANTTYALGPQVMENFTGIQNMVRVRQTFVDEALVVCNRKKTKKFLEYGIYYVEDSFLEMFNYPLQEGSQQNALAKPNNIVLTVETAKKFFGEEKALGKQVFINGGTLTGEFTVTGVVAESAKRTHFDFDYLIPITYFLTNFGLAVRDDGWHWNNYRTYFELADNAQKNSLALQVDDLLRERIGDDLDETNQTLQASFQPLSDIYLDPFIDGDSGLFKGNKSNLRTLTLVSLMILLIAVINYVNLASARSYRKKEEVAVKSALGAKKSQLLFQYFFESFLFNLLALGLSILMILLLSPALSNLMGQEVALTLVYSPRFWITIIALLIALSVLTGLHPALLSIKLSSLSKSTIGASATKNQLLKRGMIAFQLLVSLLMIAGTWVVYHQVHYMKSTELGIDLEKLFIVQGPRAVLEEGREVMKTKQARFKKTLEDYAYIELLTVSSNFPGTGGIWEGGVRKLGDPRDQEAHIALVLADEDFTTAYSFEFLAGAPFRPDMADYEAVIINEQALKSLGLSTPQDALEHSVVLENMDTMRIHGVVKDVHWNSLHKKVGPMIFGVNDFPAFLSIKLSTQNLPKTLELIEQTFQ